MRKLQTWFLTGLLTLLPLWLVWIVFKFIFSLLSELSQPWVAPSLNRFSQIYPELLSWLNLPWMLDLVALINTVLVVIIVGALATRVIGQQLLDWAESLIGRVPLVGTIYRSTRQLLDMLKTKPGSTQRVVLVDFPHKDMKAIGFVTRTLFEEGTGRELAAVYVPTTPNPTSGYLEIVPVELLTPTDWTVDEAMAFIISGGAVSPKQIPFSRPGKTNAP